jgi:hypothetical protein
VNYCNCPDCRTKDCPNGTHEAALLRDIETVVRECEKLAGHRLMQVAGPARRFLNLLRRHVKGAGVGFRLLRCGEKIVQGDEALVDGAWEAVTGWTLRARFGPAFNPMRRKEGVR